MGSQKRKHTHTHRIIRVNDVWKCALPNCVFFMYNRQAQNVLMGRNVVCWGCAKDFPMDEECFKLELPMCLDCRAPGVKELTEDIPTSPHYGGMSSKAS